MNEVIFSKEIESIIDVLDYSKLGKNVAIKVHFGEKGCTTFVNPEIIKKVYNKIISTGRKASLVECNVLYRGERMIASTHMKLAKEHGFDFAPIDILDGELGDKSIEVNKCKLGGGIKKYDSMVVISHFKGHEMAGFGGAIKNIGMGLGSRGGKLDMHSKICPSVNSRCIACGLCIQNCGSDAIITEDKKAKILPEKCTGCAMCIAVCPNNAVVIPWGGASSTQLQERIAEYAKAVDELFKGKMIYLNVLEKITKNCDCMAINERPIMEDIGFLSGYDSVAIDKASLDLVNKNSEKFKKINSVDKEFQITYAEKIGLGKKEYHLKTLK